MNILKTKTLFTLLLCALTTVSMSQSKSEMLHCYTPTTNIGTIYYKEGTVLKVPLNYNMLTNRMEIYEDGKKKAIDRAQDVEYIGLGLNKFVYLDGDFGEILFDGDKVMLTVVHGYKQIKEGKTQNLSKDKLSRYIEQNGTLPAGITLKPDSVLYLVRQTQESKGFHLAVNRIESVSLRAYNKIFANHKDKIGKYIKEHQIDLTNTADIKKLTTYCDQL